MLCDKLKLLKDKSKLTIKQIAEISGVPESTVSRMMSGETGNPTYLNLYDVVTAMGGTMADLSDDASSGEKEAPPTVVDAYRVAYQNAVEDRSYWRKAAMIELGIVIFLIVALVALFTYDILNGNVGWFRYATSHFKDAVGALLGDKL